MNDETRSLARRLMEGEQWSVAQSRTFFASVVRGETDPQMLTGVVSTLNSREPTVAELTGAAQALLDSATPFPRPDYPFADIVGTGGDGHNTINLSTIAAITAAASGVKVVKHGNRSITSCSGSFDFLESLAVEFEISPEQSRDQVDRHNVCFLFAPRFHAGLRHAASVRQALKVRTIFNLLGPLVNPARPAHMLLGVANPKLLMPLAATLQALGCQSGAVVHGSGVDEVAVHGPTEVVEFNGEHVTRYRLAPADFGCGEYPLEALTCSDAAASHQRSARVLSGQGTAAENAAVCVNVALLMKQMGKADLLQNFATAMDVLRSGGPDRLVARIRSEPS